MMITVWDLSTFKAVRSFKAHDAPVIAMDIDRSSTLVATGSADSTVKVWDVDRGYCTHNFKGHGGIITSVKFHPSTDKLCLVTASDDGVVRVWNLKTRKCEVVIEAHSSVVRSIAFSDNDDGMNMITAGRDGIINVWDWRRKSLVRTIPLYEAIEGAGILLSKTNVDLGIGSSADTSDMRIIYSGGERGIMRL
ncbi:U3 small nucleolar RNA-associated protein, partial [Coemansia sp. RSA 1804]